MSSPLRKQLDSDVSQLKRIAAMTETSPLTSALVLRVRTLLQNKAVQESLTHDEIKKMDETLKTIQDREGASKLRDDIAGTRFELSRTLLANSTMSLKKTIKR